MSPKLKSQATFEPGGLRRQGLQKPQPPTSMRAGGEQLIDIDSNGGVASSTPLSRAVGSSRFPGVINGFCPKHGHKAVQAGVATNCNCSV